MFLLLNISTRTLRLTKISILNIFWEKQSQNACDPTIKRDLIFLQIFHI